jgi:hypothetical protein
MMRTLLIALAFVAAPRTEGAARPLYLEVAGQHGVLWRANVDRYEDFKISFLHSSERCRWTQRYRVVAPGHIEQLDSTFGCYGSGMPAFAADGSAVVRTVEGYTVAARSDMGAGLSMMAWHPGDIKLAIRGHSVPIGGWFGDFESIFVRVR